MSLANLNQSMVSGQFQLGLNDGPQRQWVSDLSIDSNTPGQLSVPYGFVSEVPTMKKIKGMGGAEVSKPVARRITVVNEEYEANEQFRTFDLVNDQTGELLGRAEEFGMEVRDLQWRIVRDLIENGATSGYTSWDGKVFFATDHAYDQSGTQSNKVTSATAGLGSLNVSDSDDPSAEEVAEFLNACIAYMTGFKDGKGRTINRNMRHVIAAVPTNMLGAFRTAVYANNMNTMTTAISGLQGLRADGLRIDLIGNTESTATTVFKLFNVSNRRRKPFIFQTHTPARIDYLGVGSPYEVDNRAVKVSAYWAGAAAYGEPLTALHATLD